MAASLSVYDYILNTSTGLKIAERFTVSRTGAHEHHGVIAVGTSEEELTIHADIGSLGAWKFINLDDTNFVEIGPATTVYQCALPAGQSFRGYGPDALASFFLKADTASIDLEFHFWEA